MTVSQKIILVLSGMVATLSFPACNGILGNIYDEPETSNENQYGFKNIDEGKNTGSIYINSSEYTKWNYIDLHERKIYTTNINDETPENWDFAFHRYDTKTNNGAVCETNASSFEELPDISTLPSDSFVKDKWTTDKIVTDMSQMMDGILVYAEDWYNPILSKWLDVDKSSMPPIYTLSKKTYIIKFADGTYAALRIPYFMNDSGEKGYITIDYLYPIEYDR